MDGIPLIEQNEISTIQINSRTLYSEYLERDVLIDAYIPANSATSAVKLLLANDGQDLRTMKFETILAPLIKEGRIEPIIVVGIHCSHDRLMEYGTACTADFKGRGAKAGLYSKFVLDELLPFIKENFKLESFEEKSFAGFSLGALSAMDNVWNHSQEFSKAGVFSGALWWRRHGYEDPAYDEQKDRIMHLQVKEGAWKKSLKFFFECGALDETADRNNNGIIDSIDDTLDMIKHLKDLGYTETDIEYLELADGAHNVETWARAFPAFLLWGWGKK